MKYIEIIRGLIRPFIAVSFVAVTLYMTYLGKLDAKEVLSITAMIVAFYFGERSALKKPEGK
jgi:type IV secretory pathway VirB2 component (pilin)